jgi:hypothetical protein
LNENRVSKEWGQSLVLVAAAMVVLVGFVALAVDLGNAYYARRTAQNAADGAALAGVSVMATGINKNNPKLDDNIQAAMNDFAERNGIADTDGIPANDVNSNVEGWYVDIRGNRLSGDSRVGVQDGDDVPADAYGVEAIAHITATAFFGGIFGVDGYPLQARAVSQVRLACGDDCLVPLVTGVNLLLDNSNPRQPRTGECFHIWKERLVNPEDDISQGLLGWVSWTWQESVCEGDFACQEARPCPPFDQGNGCDADLLEANISPDVCASGFVAVGDWIAAAPGDMNAQGIRCALNYYLGYDDTTNPCALEINGPHSFTVPVYDYTTATEGVKSSSCGIMKDPCDIKTIGSLHYHVAGFARMQVIQYQLSSGQEYPPDDALAPEVLERINSCSTYYDFIVNPATPVPGSELTPTPTPEPPDGFRITVEFLEYVTDYSGSNECYDPTGTLWSSPKLTW